jgi:uncharacterized protein YvpB
MLKHCVANRKRRLSALPNVGLYIYNVKISGFVKKGAPYIYDISRLRVKTMKGKAATGLLVLIYRVCIIRYREHL